MNCTHGDERTCAPTDFVSVVTLCHTEGRCAQMDAFCNINRVEPILIQLSIKRAMVSTTD